MTRSHLWLFPSLWFSVAEHSSEANHRIRSRFIAKTLGEYKDPRTETMRPIPALIDTAIATLVRVAARAANNFRNEHQEHNEEIVDKNKIEGVNMLNIGAAVPIDPPLAVGD